MDTNIIILNTGGTFNKIYAPKLGELIVPQNNNAIEDILNKLYKSNKKPIVEGLIYKDSLDMNKSDRELLANKINDLQESKILIVHGTDTMNKSASFLSKEIKNKTIVFVGAMEPFSYEKVEASANLAMAIGFLNETKKKGIFICMNGLVAKHTKISKNYQEGVFECQ